MSDMILSHLYLINDLLKYVFHRTKNVSMSVTITGRITKLTIVWKRACISSGFVIGDMLHLCYNNDVNVGQTDQ